MDLLLVTPATAPLITKDEAKAHLRVEHEDEDALITALCDTAAALIEGRHGFTRRAAGVQTWELRLDDFPFCRGFELPLPPLVSVDFIKYNDANGVEQTFATDQYDVNPRGLLGLVWLKSAASWPTTSLERGAVTVRFKAGYDAPPAPLKQAALLTVAALYSGRGDEAGAKLPDAAERLLRPYRVNAWAHIEERRRYG